MKSRQCVAVESLLRKAKPLREHEDLHKELAKKRRQNSRKYKLPRSVKLVMHPEKVTIAKTTCYKLGSGKLCVMYLHGGSYVDPPLVFHWRFLQQLTREVPVSVVLPLYGRAPQHRCSRTVLHMVRVYMQLAEEWGAENIVVMGDSAGGGLALAMCEYLANKNKPQPRKIILMSPWVDVDMTGDYSSQFESDLALNLDELRYFGAAYRHELPKGYYLASPLFGLTDKLAETHVFVGGAELFLPDCEKLKKLADEKNVNMSLYKYDDMQHVFLLYPIPEAKEARKQLEEILMR